MALFHSYAVSRDRKKDNRLMQDVKIIYKGEKVGAVL